MYRHKLRIVPWWSVCSASLRICNRIPRTHAKCGHGDVWRLYVIPSTTWKVNLKPSTIGIWDKRRPLGLLTWQPTPGSDPYLRGIGQGVTAQKQDNSLLCHTHTTNTTHSHTTHTHNHHTSVTHVHTYTTHTHTCNNTLIYYNTHHAPHTPHICHIHKHTHTLHMHTTHIHTYTYTLIHYTYTQYIHSPHTHFQW